LPFLRIYLNIYLIKYVEFICTNLDIINFFVNNFLINKRLKSSVGTQKSILDNICQSQADQN